MNWFFNWLRSRWIWVLVSSTVILGAIGVFLSLNGNAAPQYKTAKVEKGTIIASVAASGTLSPVVSVQVGSQISGQIKELYADFNTEVKQGQLIAQIDPETYQYKVRQAQADLDAARAQVMMQRAEAARHALNAANAKRDYERNEQLHQKGFISIGARDTSYTNYSALAEQAKSAQAQISVAEASIKQKQAALAQTKVDLERTAIRAPVDGVVIKRSVDRGQTVAASLQAPELFIIAENLTDMQVDTSIDEAEIGRIRDGQKATFTVDAFPGRTFEGAVKRIRKSAQTVSNVVTYMVELATTNPDKELLPGMTANVRIVTDTRDNVLRVPNAALRFRPTSASRKSAGAVNTKAGGKSSAKSSAKSGSESANRRSTGATSAGRLYLLGSAGKPQEMNVQVGLTDGTMTEVIASDLKEGAEVIVGSAANADDATQTTRPVGPRMF